MMICPNCNCEISESQSVCGRCGAELCYCLKCRKLRKGPRCSACGSMLVKLSDKASMIAIRPSQRFVNAASRDVPPAENTVNIEAMSHAGRCRANNEDMILIGDTFLRDAAATKQIRLMTKTRFAAVVADGMGGHQGGQRASEIALHSFLEFVNALPAGLDIHQLKEQLVHWVIDTHQYIDRGADDPDFAKMGTTLAGCFYYGGKMYWLNIGDSRIYIMRDDILRQVTVDHTLCNLMQDSSIPSNIIYNCLGGGGDDVFADFDQLPIYPGDRILICSDGLSDMLGDGLLAEMLAEDAPIQDYVDQANSYGGTDNISVITLRFG